MEFVARMRKKEMTAVMTTAIPKTIQNPPAISSKGTRTFMPQMLATSVGMVMMMVMTVRSYITMLTLLEMTEA